MENLDRLEHTVHGMTSTFPSLRSLKTLQFIWLKCTHYILTDTDLTHLIPLK